MKHSFLALVVTVLASGVFAAENFDDIAHKDLAEAVKAKKVVLLDCNNTLTYNKNHIPGALNYGKVKADLAAKLPADKSTLVVAYCGNPDCTAYKAGANAALELGYTNVKKYSGGIAGWVKEKEAVESAPVAK